MGRNHRGIILMLPVMLLYGILIIGGLVNVIIESLGYIPSLGFFEVSFDAYFQVMSAPGFMRDLGYTIYIALLSTLIATTCGVWLAYALVVSQRIWVKKIVGLMLRFGVILPYLYMVFIVVLTFSQSGLVARFLYQLGCISSGQSFPRLVYDQKGIGIMMVYILKGIPFVTLFTFNVMSQISDTYTNVARTLSSSPLIILKRIYIPLSKDVILWTSMVLLAFDLGSFEVPYLLGSLKPKPISVSLYSYYIGIDPTHIPLTNALTIILFVFGTTTVLIYGLLGHRLLGGARR